MQGSSQSSAIRGNGIECLINLECMAYSAMTLFPYSDESFSCYQSASAQETRFGIGQQIQASITINSIMEKPKPLKIHAS